MRHAIKFRIEKRIKAPPALMCQGEISCHGGTALMQALMENMRESINENHEVIFGECKKTEIVDKLWFDIGE